MHETLLAYIREHATTPLNQFRITYDNLVSPFPSYTKQLLYHIQLNAGSHFTNMGQSPALIILFGGEPYTEPIVSMDPL